MERKLRADGIRSHCLLAGELTTEMIISGIEQTYKVLDAIDGPLVAHTGNRLAEVVELANLSSMLGNILASSIVSSSTGLFTRAGPHKYQDLRAARAGGVDVEIKVALESNRPKGHLPKAGHYLAVRYVLGDALGNATRGVRGNVVWIWEVRCGSLLITDFDISNTEGDSGKTAVVSTTAMSEKLKLVYFDDPLCPYASVERYLRNYG